MYRDDAARLYHMLDAAREAVEFAEGRTRPDLDMDRMLMRAVVKSIELIGEAASKVTKEYRRQHPEISWSAIIGMRNILIHDYADVDLDVIWDTVCNDLPVFIETLKTLIPDAPTEPSPYPAPA